MTTPQIITALPVPFDEDGGVLFDTFAAMLTRLEPLVDAGFVSGTTAEFPSLSAAERGQLLRATVDVFGPSRVVCHVGAPSLTQVLPLAEDALSLGVTKLSCVTPYYLPCDFGTLHTFYATLAGLPGAEVFIYLFPERTGLQTSPEQLRELREIDGVIGAKLSGSPNARFEEYAAAAGAGALVYSGDDGSLPRVMRGGGAGVVSGVSAAFPDRFARLRAAWGGDEDEIAAAQASVLEAVSLVGPTIPRLKMALSLRHGELWSDRMPLDAVDPVTAAKIRDLVGA